MTSEKWHVASSKSQVEELAKIPPRSLSSLLYLLPPLLAVLIYAPTISHPLMYDTLLHTQLADGQTLLSVFLPDERFGFYRPLVFLPIVFFQNLLGRYPVWLFHWLNIVTHAVNALLLTKFVWRMTGQRFSALTAGLLLASFPFAYQALAIYGNNPYLTVTFFILLALNVAVKQEKNDWKLIFIFILGVLVHETAVLIIPLVVVCTFATDRIKAENRPTLYATVQHGIQIHGRLFLTCALYLIIYLFLPRGGGPTLNFGGNALLPKILLFLQTAAWPLVLGLNRFLNGQTAILISIILLVGSGSYRFLVGRSPQSRFLLGMGLCWFLLASILIGLTLPTYYIEDGARLLYPGAAGVVLIWAGLLTPYKSQTVPRILTAFLVSALILSGAWFNRRMIGLYEMGSRPIHTIGQTLSAQQAADDLILVNLPQWVAWPQQVFPAGTEFAPIMGSHLFAAELVRANFGLTPRITILDVPEALTQVPYTYGVYRVGAIGEIQPREGQSTHVIETRYGVESPAGFWTGSILPDKGGHTVAWSAESFGFLKQTACKNSDGSIFFESTLLPVLPVDESISLFVQALTADGRLVAQNDGPPLGISIQRLKTAPHMLLVDRRSLPSSLSPDEEAETVLSGVYNFVTGEREQAVNSIEESLADNGNQTHIQSECGLAP